MRKAFTLVLMVVLGCTTDDAFKGATGETPAEFVERECMEQHIDCERVYAFTQAADNPLGRVEMCVRYDDVPVAEGLFGGPAELSPDKRFDQWRLLGVEPVCWYQCPTAKGCNSYDGCFCGE